MKREDLAKLGTRSIQMENCGRGGFPVYAGIELVGMLAGLSREATALALRG